jgi:spore germination protein YaaH
VQLNWRTITETNNYGFYVQQRSAAASAFVDVPNSFVQGHGTTLEPHDYSWTHMGVPAGTYYYRLKQVDLDGTIHYSEGREVTVLSPTGIAESQSPTAFTLAQNYPNPFNPSTQIQFSVEKAGHTTLTVFDALGRQAETLFAGTAEPGKLYSVNFDASSLTNGTYFYRLTNGGQTSLRKMLLLK